MDQVRKQFEAEIRKITRQLISRYKPEKIIIYGSAALGKTHQESDIDLVIIKNTRKNFYDRIGEVSGLVDHNLPIDFLVYTPGEFERMVQRNWFIQKEVIRKGRVIYGG